jgi:hypothetical protein
MKKLYTINKWLIIINTLLFIVPFFGLLFLIVLGGAQVTMAIIVAVNYTTLNKNRRIKFIIYSILTSIILITTQLTFDEGLINNSVAFFTVIIISVLLAFLHLNITYSLYKSEQNETN